MIYRRAIQKQLIRGRTIQSVAVASIYMACRQCNVIRTLEDVAVAANITKKEAARNYRFLSRELQPEVPQVRPTRLHKQDSEQARLTGETEMLAMGILKKASSLRLTSGRGPSGIAAACIYIAASSQTSAGHRAR